MNTFLTVSAEYLTSWFAMSIIFLIKAAKATTAIGTSLLTGTLLNDVFYSK